MSDNIFPLSFLTFMTMIDVALWQWCSKSNSFFMCVMIIQNIFLKNSATNKNETIHFLLTFHVKESYRTFLLHDNHGTYSSQFTYMITHHIFLPKFSCTIIIFSLFIYDNPAQHFFIFHESQSSRTFLFTFQVWQPYIMHIICMRGNNTTYFLPSRHHTPYSNPRCPNMTTINTNFCVIIIICLKVM